MKLKIKVKVKDDNLIPQIIKKGDWIDLRVAKNIINDNKGVSFNLIDLGIAMKLPDGYEAIVLPRSSTYKNFHIICANSMGVIDNSYCGDNDYWKFPAISFGEYKIDKYSRIAQFRIQLSQKATFLQKLKWLLVNKIEIVSVNHLENNDRGGIGSTGKI